MGRGGIEPPARGFSVRRLTLVVQRLMARLGGLLAQIAQN